ncbi:anti-phage dCTP deaminase [Corallococcus sp. AS-1-12]|uniref:anti-phage dCTP deaminase n=1 Tax=Corallococcus sp. AS-1-12 TaxID=2874598 RepID=UPI001CBE24D2|nr:anti-phage dCTP deaminase [Corallococcus sp. AS-1-12]MBZ4335924.1 cytidine deaminase [Corallococcus sp. AS-1-12]
MTLSVANALPKTLIRGTQNSAQHIIKAHSANELFFAVVGHVGSGTSTIVKALERILNGDAGRPLPGGKPYQVKVLKARDAIVNWAENAGHLANGLKAGKVEQVIQLQDLGDAMREQDHSAVARSLINSIRLARAELKGEPTSNGVVQPDGSPRAYIIDALRHPAEAHLLRSLYRNAFALIGVVCNNETMRKERLREKFEGKTSDVSITDIMTRDSKDLDPEKKNGQRVMDTFHLADYFIDNSENRVIPKELEKRPLPNSNWTVNEQLLRLVKIITHESVERPTTSETAMHAAHGAQMRSACLSRQVGAALIDGNGNLISTGTNEVPRAGGGVYSQEDHSRSHEDFRCAYRDTPECSNTKEQETIIGDLIDTVAKTEALDAETRSLLQKALSEKGARKKLHQEFRRSRVGGLLEFSRAVHAEMDALLSAARVGTSTVNCRLFVTTYPCHYCARHIVSAGVTEVQYIEPYPKSQALALHGDSIATSLMKQSGSGVNGSKVLFRPFTGVAPRLYQRAFLKDRELKRQDGGFEMGEPDWGTAWDVSRFSYADLEVKLRADAPQEPEVRRG